ncbi:peptidoglycan D,D-transpeptidase FtsI family protein [Allokutzneria oryzae]|uniref:Peptidoglycan D,D-transpeptidase FtsI family protein n=1 Tax=Allokutzneria oryzae TaxID=1378989 RepID=A0ABV6A3U5_9PSEU
MNTPLRRVALAMMGMIVLLLANATYVQVIKGDDYRKDPRNTRVLLEAYSRERGKIITAGGGVIATSEETNTKLRFLRKYPEGPMYAPVTGFYSVSYSSTQLERAEDDVLNGSDSTLFVRRLSDLITGRDPKGANVETTINPRIQQAAYKAMTDKGFTGSVVAMRPDTGEILGMVSTPSYDPNRVASHDVAARQQAWKELSQDKDKPMLNRAISENYPPGSTFKLVVAAAALENGMTKDTQLTAAPNITLPGTSTRLENFDGNRCGSGQTASLEEALARSCNTAFAELAGQIGEDKLRRQAEKFGIGEQDLKIPMSVVPSTLGDIPDKSALYQTGIGQRDVKLTPLQDLVVAATVANGGMRMEPQLKKRIVTHDVSVLDEVDPKQAGRAMSSSSAETLKQMMIKSEERTQGSGKMSNVVIASKTGTAEHGANPKQTKPHAWYVAFAPADKPKIAVVVMVEDGGDRGLEATGGSVAAPIGRAVIRAGLEGG